MKILASILCCLAWFAFSLSAVAAWFVLILLNRRARRRAGFLLLLFALAVSAKAELGSGVTNTLFGATGFTPLVIPVGTTGQFTNVWPDAALWEVKSLATNATWTVLAKVPLERSITATNSPGWICVQPGTGEMVRVRAVFNNPPRFDMNGREIFPSPPSAVAIKMQPADPVQIQDYPTTASPPTNIFAL